MSQRVIPRRKSSDRTRRKNRVHAIVEKARELGNVTLFCHQNADPDSVCSALAMKELLLAIEPGLEVDVSCPMGISSQSRELIKNLELDSPRVDGQNEKNTGLCIIVDTNNLAQLGPGASSSVLESKNPIVVIDHHHRHPDMNGIPSLEIVDETSTSTAEIVMRLYDEAGMTLGLKSSRSLLAVLFAETKSFAFATRSTFDNAAKLVAKGAEPKETSMLLARHLNRDERIARLKAASRSKIESVEGWLLVSSEVGSYQSSAARSLLSLGGDVAIVAGLVKGTVRVNFRASDAFYRETGVHLGRDLAIPVGSMLGGSGGGHPTAAGMHVKGRTSDAVKKCMVVLRGLLAGRRVVQS